MQIQKTLHLSNKGTFTIFAEKSKIDRELIRYQKYGGNLESSVLNQMSQNKRNISQLLDQISNKNSRNQKQEITNLKSNSSIKKKSKGPTLEAVLNYSSVKNLNCPAVLPKIRSSLTKNLMQLPMVDKFTPIHEVSRLEHATWIGKDQLSSRYVDSSKELTQNIEKFESILEGEKKFYTQPLYFQGHIITRRSPPRQPKNDKTFEHEDFEEQLRRDIENYQLMNRDYVDEL